MHIFVKNRNEFMNSSAKYTHMEIDYIRLQLTSTQSPYRFWSHTNVMDYDRTYLMHLTTGVVHYIAKVVHV